MIPLYIGPGVGAATIILVGVVLAIVLLSLVIVMWSSLKRAFNKLRQLFSKK